MDSAGVAVLVEGIHAGAVLKRAGPEGTLVARRVWEHALRIQRRTFDCLVIEAERETPQGTQAVKTWYCAAVPLRKLREETPEHRRAKTAMHDNAVRALAFRLSAIAAIPGEADRETAAHKLWADLSKEIDEFRGSGVEPPEVVKQAAGLAADVVEGRLPPDDLERRARDLHDLLNDAYRLPESMLARLALWDPYVKLRAYFRQQAQWKDAQIDKLVNAFKAKYPRAGAVYTAVTELNQQLERTTAGSTLLKVADYADNAFQIYDAYMSGRDPAERAWAASEAIGRVALLNAATWPLACTPASVRPAKATRSRWPVTRSMAFSSSPCTLRALLCSCEPANCVPSYSRSSAKRRLTGTSLIVRGAVRAVYPGSGQPPSPAAPPLRRPQRRPRLRLPGSRAGIPRDGRAGRRLPHPRRRAPESQPPAP